MKKFLLSFFIIFTFILYSLGVRFGEKETIPVNVNLNTSLGNNLTSPTPTTSSSSGASPTPTIAQTTPALSGFKNGEFTGDIVDAYYGNVQVKAVISQGKITDVQFLDYPHDRQRSNSISSQAMPMLKTEAIQAQSANVDIISGATATSQAFIQSLNSALAKAK